MPPLDYFRVEKGALCWDDLWISGGFDGERSAEYSANGDLIAADQPRCAPVGGGYRVMALSVKRSGERALARGAGAFDRSPHCRHRALTAYSAACETRFSFARCSSRRRRWPKINSCARGHAQLHARAADARRADGGRIDGAVLAHRAALAGESLYAFDVQSGQTRVLITPEQILKGAEEKLSQAEKAQRERQRISTRGFTGFQLSDDGAQILVTLSGKLYVVRRADNDVIALDTGKLPTLNPTFSPDATKVAYVHERDLYVYDMKTKRETRLTKSTDPAISNGLAEFVAQEEMKRVRGFWWSPDGTQLAYEEADNRGVEQLTIPDVAHPEHPPEPTYYPRPNPSASIRVVDVYAGPGYQQVTASPKLMRQWMADHGVIVVAIEGAARGARPRLGALHRGDSGLQVAACARSRPSIRDGRRASASRPFGGYESALAVLKRGDVFHVAVAGAPVVDWRDYDTHYTEHYLGLLPENKRRTTRRRCCRTSAACSARSCSCTAPATTTSTSSTRSSWRTRCFARASSSRCCRSSASRTWCPTRTSPSSSRRDS